MCARLTTEVETAIYRLVQEGLNNIARHAHVNEAYVSVRRKDKTIWIRIEDQGAGIGTYAVSNSSPTSGLTGMQERVELLQGGMTIDSSNGRVEGMWVKLRRLLRHPDKIGTPQNDKH